MTDPLTLWRAAAHSFWNWYSRILGWGQCRRCRKPWQIVDGHSVQYTESRGIFALCEKCWAATTPGERVVFYSMVLDAWGEEYIAEQGVTDDEILQAVREDRQLDYYGWTSA